MLFRSVWEHFPHWLHVLEHALRQESASVLHWLLQPWLLQALEQEVSVAVHAAPHVLAVSRQLVGHELLPPSDLGPSPPPPSSLVTV